VVKDRQGPTFLADGLPNDSECLLTDLPVLPKSRSDFSATFTTIAFDDSSLRWLEINT
jgi:hypothetical protein